MVHSNAPSGNGIESTDVVRPSTTSDIDPAGGRLSIRERIAYGVGDIGGNVIFAPISAFLLFYLTDTVGIGAAIAGTMLLFGRLLDGTLDLFVGTLIDKTSTRWGKARPWILFSMPVLVISFVLLFNVPAGLDEDGREIYAFVFYFLCLGVGFVCSNLAYHTLLSVITSNGTMRVSLTIIRTFCAILTTLVVSLLTIPLLAAFGGGQQGWSGVVLVYGAVAAITLLVLFFGTRERVTAPTAAQSSAKQPIGTLLKALTKNKFFLLGFALFFSVNILTGTSSVGVFFAKDVLGDASIYGLLGAVQLLPILIGMWFMPRIIGRFGKRVPFLVGLAVTAAGILISLIDPSNIGLILIGGLVRSIGTVPGTAVMFALIADIVDYGEWKTGMRVDGMTYAAATAGQNFGAGLGAALVGWLLAAGGYDAAATAQSDSALATEVFLLLWIPLILVMVQAVIMLLLNTDKYLPAIHRDLAERRREART